MRTWTKQIGFPVLDVTCKTRTDNTITLAIEQSKFRANATKDAGEKNRIACFCQRSDCITQGKLTFTGYC